MYHLIVSTLFTFTLLSSVVSSNAKGLPFLTPVSDPFEYQNEYYPITVGNYWQMLYLSVNGGNNIELKGRYEYRIIEYTFEEIYFGDSLMYVPVFKKESKFFRPNSEEAETVTYTYLIKTYQGIIESVKPPVDNWIKPYLFVPSDSSFDYLSYDLTKKTIERNVELKTRYWEMSTIRISYKDKDNLGGFFYSINKGHVYTQFFYKKSPSSYQTNIYEKETFEPASEFILSEYKIE